MHEARCRSTAFFVMGISCRDDCPTPALFASGHQRARLARRLATTSWKLKSLRWLLRLESTQRRFQPAIVRAELGRDPALRIEQHHRRNIAHAERAEQPSAGIEGKWHHSSRLFLVVREVPLRCPQSRGYSEPARLVARRERIHLLG